MHGKHKSMAKSKKSISLITDKKSNSKKGGIKQRARGRGRFAHLHIVSLLKNSTKSLSQVLEACIALVVFVQRLNALHFKDKSIELAQCC